MKRWIGLIALVTMAAHAENGFREFTASDGRKLTARVLSFDAASGKVQIEREDGKKLQVSPSAFSDRDQLYFKTWSSAQAFTSTAKLKLEVKREASDTRKKDINIDIGEEFSGGRRGGESGVITVAVDKTTSYKYNLTILNKTGVPLKNVTMEYRVFYEQEKPVKDEKANKGRREDDPRPEQYMAVSEEKIKDGRVKLKPIESGETKVLSTESIKLMERSANRQWGENIDLKSDLAGVWFRLTMKGPDGDKLVRDIALPASVMKKYPWEVPEVQVQEQPAEDEPPEE